MNKAEKIIELTKLINETLTNLDALKLEKEILKLEYEKEPKNAVTLKKISDLEKKYAILYKKSLELNIQIHKLKNS